MAFRVGERVVCVDDSDIHGLGLIWADADGPTEGEIYTVTSIHADCLGDLVLHLAEIRRGPIARREWGETAGYNVRRFRPLISRKSEISFTQGADPSTDKLDNRRKVRERV